MNTLESLVPPLELCKQIPEGCFEDSAMVWWGNHVYMRSPGDAVTPAPTLAEIVSALAKMEDCPNLGAIFINGKVVYSICGGQLKRSQGNDAEEVALKLWLELNKE